MEKQTWVVWEITAKGCKEIMRSQSKVLADNVAELKNKAHRSIRYEVTKAGDTPVW